MLKREGSPRGQFLLLRFFFRGMSGWIGDLAGGRIDDWCGSIADRVVARGATILLALLSIVLGIIFGADAFTTPEPSRRQCCAEVAVGKCS